MKFIKPFILFSTNLLLAHPVFAQERTIGKGDLLACKASLVLNNGRVQELPDQSSQCAFKYGPATGGELPVGAVLEARCESSEHLYVYRVHSESGPRLSPSEPVSFVLGRLPGGAGAIETRPIGLLLEGKGLLTYGRIESHPEARGLVVQCFLRDSSLSR